MGKLKIRSCTRCQKGEIFIDRDQYGWYECCLQCGYTRDLPDIEPAAPGGFKNAAREAAPELKIRSIPARKGAPGQAEWEEHHLAPV